MAEISETKLKNTLDAREKNLELLNSNDKMAAHFIYYFSWFWAIMSCSYFFCVTLVPIAETSKHFADIILGFLLGTTVATIIGYFYGNSDS